LKRMLPVILDNEVEDDRTSLSHEPFHLHGSYPPPSSSPTERT
jgi:hypothetical protein